MIEFTVGQIRSQHFTHVMRRLSSQPMGFKMSYHIARIAKLIDQEAKFANDEFNKKVEALAESIDPKTGEFKIKEEHGDEWIKWLTEFSETKVAIEKNKIYAQDLEREGVKLAPSEILLLEPLFFDLEVVEGGSNEKSDEENKG